MFQTAIACKELGKEKEANFFINYVNKQLEFIYKGTENKTYNGTNYFSIVGKFNRHIDNVWIYY